MAITINSFVDNVPGSLRQRAYNLNIGVSGDILTCNLGPIKAVNCNDTAVSKMAVSGNQITFTITGATTNTLVDVLTE